jgi:hypothetical protein
MFLDRAGERRWCPKIRGGSCTKCATPMYKIPRAAPRRSEALFWCGPAADNFVIKCSARRGRVLGAWKSHPYQVYRIAETTKCIGSLYRSVSGCIAIQNAQNTSVSAAPLIKRGRYDTVGCDVLAPIHGIQNWTFPARSPFRVRLRRSPPAPASLLIRDATHRPPVCLRVRLRADELASDRIR